MTSNLRMKIYLILKGSDCTDVEATMEREMIVPRVNPQFTESWREKLYTLAKEET